MNIIIVTPRTHPNLSYILQALGSHVHNVLVVVDNLTSEVAYPHYVRVVLSSDPLLERKIENYFSSLARIDLVITRHYKRKTIRRIRAIPQIQSAFWVQYDQDPAPESAMGIVWEEALSFYRVLRRRPAFRITPAGKHDSLVPLGRTWATFQHPIDPGPPSWPSQSSQETIVCVAKLGQPRKRVVRLMKALVRIGFIGNLSLIGLSAYRNNVSIGIFRTLPYRWYWGRIKSYSRKLPHTITLKIVEDATHSQARRIISESALMVSPAIREPFSISALEAMSSGVPCIVSSWSGSKYFVDSVSTKLVFSWAVPWSLERALQSIYEDRPMMKYLSKLSLEIAKSQHSQVQFARFIEGLIDSRI